MNNVTHPLPAELFPPTTYETPDDPHGSAPIDAAQLPQDAPGAPATEKKKRSTGNRVRGEQKGRAAGAVGSPDCDVVVTFAPEDDGDPAHEPDDGTVGAVCNPGATPARTNTAQNAVDTELLEPHDLAGLFPPLTPPELDDLVDSLKQDGQLHDITTYGGKILDGWNRYLACQKAGLEPRLAEYTGSDPVGFVFAQNVHRRHLSSWSRGLLASDRATIKDGQFAGNQHSPPSIEGGQPPGKSVKVAAEEMNVARSTVERVRKIKKQGTPALMAAVKAGTVSVGAAADIAKLSAHDQLEMLAKGPDAVREKAASIRKESAGQTPGEKRAHAFDNPGRVIWRKARKLLDAIKPRDANFEEVMRHIAEYGQKRLEDHAKKS